MIDRGKRKGPITAEEFNRLREQDPEYQERRRKWEAETQVLKAEMDKASALLREDLRQLGIEVEYISQLFNTHPVYRAAMGWGPAVDYREAIPVLLQWLPKIEHKTVKEEIIRALTVHFARPQAAPPLIEEWRKIPPGEELDIKWVIGNALDTVADDSVFDDLVDLLRDKRDGHARMMIARCLWRMKNPQVLGVLIELLDDNEPGVVSQAVYALGRLKRKALTIRGKVEALANHPHKWVRDAVKKAVASFDKVE